MKNTLTKILFSFFLVLTVGLIFVPGNLSNKADAASCSTGLLCFYQDINYGGNGYVTVPTVGVCNTLPSSWNNVISSIQNGTSHDIKIYDGATCNNATGTIFASTIYPDLRQYCTDSFCLTGTWNDRISSWKAL